MMRVKRVSSIVASLLAVGAVLAPAASAAPGELDPSFGTGGSVRSFFAAGIKPKVRAASPICSAEKSSSGVISNCAI